MNCRTLGRTGLSVSALALGTVELGLDYGIQAPGAFGRPSEAQSVRIVHAALDAGINFIDTARAYGASETVLGKALRGRREGVVLATKVTVHRPDGSLPDEAELGAAMLDALHTSLRQLRTDWVDIWQVHNADTAVLERAEAMAAVFDAARRAGKIRWTGASFYGAELPLQALEVDLFDVMQVTYSLLDQRLQDQFFAVARARDVGIVARSVLLKGALTARAEHLPDHLQALRQRSRQFRQVLADTGVGLSPAQAALAFVLHTPPIDAVLVGVRSQAELIENLQAVEATLPDHLMERLRALRIDDETLLDPSRWGIP